MLAGASRFSREFDRGQGELAALLGAHAAALLDAAIALDRERRSAHTDPLPGCSTGVVSSRSSMACSATRRRSGCR